MKGATSVIKNGQGPIFKSSLLFLTLLTPESNKCFEALVFWFIFCSTSRNALESTVATGNTGLFTKRVFRHYPVIMPDRYILELLVFMHWC